MHNECGAQQVAQVVRLRSLGRFAARRLAPLSETLETKTGLEMTSVIYASISALIIVWLSLNVINKRRTLKVSIGDGNQEELKTAIAAQSNSIEYIPIYLLLLFALEFNDANIVIVHIFGLLLVIGRVTHARGILSGNLGVRVKGMQITLYSLIALALTNFVYLPYEKII